MKGLKRKILTRQESRNLSRLDVFYFLPTAHFLKQLPTHTVLIAKAPQAKAATKALSKECNFADTQISNTKNGLIILKQNQLMS